MKQLVAELRELDPRTLVALCGSLVLAVVFALGLNSCGGNASAGPTSDSGASGSAVATSTPHSVPAQRTRHAPVHARRTRHAPVHAGPTSDQVDAYGSEYLVCRGSRSRRSGPTAAT